jgi:hypothetical protein
MLSPLSSWKLAQTSSLWMSFAFRVTTKKETSMVERVVVVRPGFPFAVPNQLTSTISMNARIAIGWSTPAVLCTFQTMLRQVKTWW